MLHRMIEPGGAPFFYRDADECERELLAEERTFRSLLRLGRGVEKATDGLDGEGNEMLAALLARAQELAGECREALRESERLLSALDEERADILELMERAR